MSYDLLPTPNPSEFSVRVWAGATQVFSKMSALVVGVTTLAELDLGIVPISEGFGGHVYAKCEGPDAQGRLGFTFVKARTALERATAFDEYPETEDVDWPAVCRWIHFNPNWGAPKSQSTMDSSGKLGTVLIPRWVVRRDYLHGQRIKTTVIVRKFLSENPWPVGSAELKSNEPMPTEIPWDLEGNFGSTGPCLHDEKDVPGQGSAYPQVTNAGNAETAVGSDNRTQHIPKTNHLKWRNFVTNDVKFVEPRLFLRIEKTYIAPPMPEGSILS